jgi:hypothetical protein
MNNIRHDDTIGSRNDHCDERIHKFEKKKKNKNLKMMPAASPMDIQVWGPSGWNFMHAVTFAYPHHPTQNDIAAARSFFHSITALLPCERCREHYARMLEAHPIEPHLTSRDTLARWLVDAHNTVNVRLHKHEIPYADVRARYLGAPPSPPQSSSSSSGNGDCKQKRCNVVPIIILILVLCATMIAAAVGGVFLWKQRKPIAIVRRRKVNFKN